MNMNYLVGHDIPCHCVAETPEMAIRWFFFSLGAEVASIERAIEHLTTDIMVVECTPEEGVEYDGGLIWPDREGEHYDVETV